MAHNVQRQSALSQPREARDAGNFPTKQCHDTDRKRWESAIPMVSRNS